MPRAVGKEHRAHSRDRDDAIRACQVLAVGARTAHLRGYWEALERHHRRMQRLEAAQQAGRQ